MSKAFHITLWVLIGVCLPVSAFNFLPAILLMPRVTLASVLIAAALAVLGVYLWRLSPMWARPGLGWASASVLWGAGTAATLALISGLPLPDLSTNAGWGAAAASWGGAYPEEYSKALGVVFVLLSFRQLNRPWHGLVVGALIGWGFEVFENALYATFGAMFDPSSDWVGMIQMWGLRLVAGPCLHMSLTAIAGWGIGWALLSAFKPWTWRLGVALGFLALSFCLHFAWNYMWDAAWAQVTQYVVVAAILYPTLIYLTVRGHRLATADHTYSYAPGSAHFA